MIWTPRKQAVGPRSSIMYSLAIFFLTALISLSLGPMSRQSFTNVIIKILFSGLQKTAESETRGLKPSSPKSVLSLSCHSLGLCFRLYNVFVSRMICFSERLQPSFLRSFTILGFSFRILTAKVLKSFGIYIQMSSLRSVLKNAFTKSIYFTSQSFITIIINSIY